MPIEVPENIKKWFADQKVVIRLFPDETTRKFRSLSRLHDFIQKEHEYWKSSDPQVAAKFNQALGSIRNAVTNPNNENSFLQQLNAALLILNATNATNSTIRNNQYILYSDSAFTTEAVHVREKYGDVGYRAFLAGVLDSTTAGPQTNGWDKNQFWGLFDAYVYQNLNDRLDSKLNEGETSLADAQSRFNVFLTEGEGQQTAREETFTAFCKEYRDWKKRSSTKFKKLVDGASQNHYEQMASQEERFNESKKQWEDRFNTDEQNWNKRVEELEELYKNKLMLEAPVKYWEKLEKRHRETGRGFAIAASVTVVVLVGILGALLYNWPPEWLEAGKWNLNTLKGSFLLLTVTSLSLYVVHFLAKFAISSYHLARDAEERRQLTYVYLSLLQRGAVSDEQQKIILSALFSRADTGLLKGDHSPTMPAAAQLFGMMK